MSLFYPGIDVPRQGLTISIGMPQRGDRSGVVRQGHGWLRLIVRATQAPALRLAITSNEEAMPEHCADVGLGIQHEFTTIADEELSDLDLMVPMSGATSRVIFWTKHFGLQSTPCKTCGCACFRAPWAERKSLSPHRQLPSPRSSSTSRDGCALSLQTACRHGPAGAVQRRLAGVVK